MRQLIGGVTGRTSQSNRGRHRTKVFSAPSSNCSSTKALVGCRRTEAHCLTCDSQNDAPRDLVVEEKRMPIQQRHVDADGCSGTPSVQEPTQAFGQMLSRELPMLYRRAYQLLGNKADAEDALQDALLAAYTHLGQFKGESRMSTWMTTIVHNSARMLLRKRRHHLQVPLEDQTEGEQPLCERVADHRPSPEHECSESELSTHLRRAHRQLSPRLRRAFQLRDIDGLSIQEAGHILGVPVGTVKAQSARARKKILELLRRRLRRTVPNRRGSLPDPLCRKETTHANQDRAQWKSTAKSMSTQ